MKDLMKHIYVLAVFLTAAIPASPAKQQESIRWSGNEKVKESLCLKADLSLSYDSDALIGADNGLIYVGAGDNRGSRVEFISYENKEDVEILPVLEGLKGAPFGTVYGGEAIVSGLPTEGTSSVVYLLNTASPDKGWKKAAVIPGVPRGYAAAAVQSNGTNPSLYVIGGISDADSTALTDGYSYDLILRRWVRIPCVFPENISAAMPSGANHLLLVGKDDKGEMVLYRFHTITSTITDAEPVTAGIDRIFSFVRAEGSDMTVICVGRDGKPVLVQGNILHPERSLGVINWVVIALYFLVLAGIGFYFARRQNNTNDYFKGGGRIPWWAAGLSLFGTALSAITFMAIPAKAFSTDWSYGLFNVGIVLVAPVIVFVFIPYFRKLNITTAYQYLEIRFNAAIRVLCSVAFIVFQVGRMGVVLFLPSIALNVVTGIDIFLCIGIMGLCSILYTMTGGIEAVVWTDAIQVIILLGGALFAVGYITMSIPGGFAEAISISSADGKFSLGSTGFDLQDSTMWTVLIAAFFTNLTTYGTDQSMVQRYLTTPSQSAAKKSVWTNALLTIPATIIFFLIGSLLYAYYKTFPESLSISINSADAVFPWYIFTELPAGVTGLLISGIFAAAMSTLSGSMNSAATAYIVDIYPRITRRGAGSLRAARFATCVTGLISLAFAFLMATWNIASLWDEFQKILGLILGSMGGLFMLGMLTRRANSGGAIIGIVVSILVQIFVARFHTLHLLLYTASGFVSCFVVGYAASYLFPDSNKRTITSNNNVI